MAKSPDWTMITMPYDLTVDTNKISDSCLPPRVLEITSNGSYNVIPYTRVNVDVVAIRSNITVKNNSSYRITCMSLGTTGKMYKVAIGAGVSGHVYGALDDTDKLTNWAFAITIEADCNLRTSGFAYLVKAGSGAKTTYICVVNKANNDPTVVDITILDA